MNPFDDIQENDEFSSSPSPTPSSPHNDAASLETMDLPFDFPEEAAFIVTLWGRDYKVDPSSLLIAPQEWRRVNDTAILDAAIEAASSWAYSIFEAYLQAKAALTMFQEREKAKWNQRREMAEAAIFKARAEQVKAKLRTNVGSSVNKDDLEHKLADMFQNEWIEYSAKLRQLKNDVSRLENLHTLINNRIWSLREIASRMHKDKYKG